MGEKAVFIDRDGTINVNTEYLNTIEEFEFYPGVCEGINKLNQAGFKIIVITNQSAIARDFLTEKKLKKIHKYMINQLKKYNAEVDDIYYCPHHPDENCDCRKPGTLLLEKAIREHNLDPKKSYMIGDRALDVIAAQKIKAKGIIVPEPKNRENALKEMKEKQVKPDYLCDSFKKAVSWILSEQN